MCICSSLYYILEMEEGKGREGRKMGKKEGDD